MPLPTPQSVAEPADVLIVGVGISGIGAARHHRQQCPGKRFVLLDSQDGHGGTWCTHRDPGVRAALGPCFDGQEQQHVNPGYMARGVDQLPRQGTHAPWRHSQDYWTERDELPAADLDDGALVYR